MKVTKAICVPLLVCLLLGLAFMNSGVRAYTPPAKPTIKVERVSGVEPVIFTGKAGTSFKVKVKIYDVGYMGMTGTLTDVYAWQILMTWSNTLLQYASITWGTFMDCARAGPWGLLTSNAPAGWSNVTVSSALPYYEWPEGAPPGWGTTVLIIDDFHSEYNTLTGRSGNTLHLAGPLTNTYTVAANAGCYPVPDVGQAAAPGPLGNRLMAGQFVGGDCPGVQGNMFPSGWLCTITFNVLAEGATTLDIDSEWAGDQTFIMNTYKETVGEEASGAGDPGYWQKELLKESGEFVPPWAEDFDGDGSLAVFDLASIGLKFGMGPGYVGPEDLNGDGWVDVADLSLLSVDFQDYAN